jgi:hypothetical protein
MNWKHKVALKHLFTREDNYESLQNSMNKVADVIENEQCLFSFLGKNKFRKLPKKHTLETANLLLSKLYDYADANNIWID